MENRELRAKVEKVPPESSCPKALEVALTVVETRVTCVFVLSLVCLCLNGCDPVRTVRQSILIRVAEQSGAPVPDVKVRMKESWESWKLTIGEVPQAELNGYHSRWLSEPWLEGMTDAGGEALIMSEITALDWNKGSAPPVERDVVSDREYIVELSRQNVSEKVSIKLRQGATGKGNIYTVSVESIEKPTYINESDS